MALELLPIPRPRWLIYAVAAALLAGIFFRVYNFDRKVYWNDEIYTSLRAQGYTEADWVRRSSRITEAAGLRELLYPTAAQRPSASATVMGLANEEPQKAPVYFLAAHYWELAFGDSMATLRGLSIAIGLLALPAAFWMCVELFEATAAGWIGVALFASSPLLVLYSQEAREYSLWALVIFLLGASFLRASRLGSIGAWALYAVILTFGLYVYSPCAFLALGQAAYLVALEWKRPRTLLYPAIAVLLAILCFSPWLFVMARGSEHINRALVLIVTTKHPALYILREFMGHLRLNFFDFNAIQSLRLNVALSLPVIALIVYSLYFLCRNSTPRVWGYVAATIIFTTLPVVAPDLLFAGERSRGVRYLFPLFVGIDLAIVYVLYSKLRPGVPLLQARLWQALFVAILACRIASCAVSSQAETWWNKYDETSIAAARIINRASHPLLISDEYIVVPVGVGIYLRPNVRVELRPRCYLCANTEYRNIDVSLIERGTKTDDVFVLGSPELAEQVKYALGAGASSHFHPIDLCGGCPSTQGVSTK